MKASKLIARISELKEKFGDLPVYHDGKRRVWNADTDDVKAYNETGQCGETDGTPDDPVTPNHIFIH